MENRRFILLALLGVVLFFMYQAWEKDYASPAPQGAAPVSPATLTLDAPAAAQNSDVPLATPGTSPQQALSAVPDLVQIQTDLFRAQISTQGGELRKLELLGYPEVKAHSDQPLALLDDSSTRWFVLQSGLAGTAAALTTPQTLFSSTQPRYVLADGAEFIDVPLQFVSPEGYAVTKTYRFSRGSYRIELKQTLQNQSAAELTVSPYVRFARTAYSLGGEPKFTPTFLGVGVYEQREDASGYRFRKEAFEDLDDEILERKQTGGWLAMLQHYFVVAILPPADEALSFTAKPARERGYLAQYVGATYKVPAAGEQTFATGLYIGPKQQSQIGEIAPGLELTLDYGILTALCKPLFWILEQLHGLSGNWGWAIVLLTLLVRSAMYKLSEAQYRSMAKMKKFAPKIQDIKDRYADDRERLQKAMMDLYKKEGFNPLAGCWPLLVQMPVFFALYWVLLESVELRQAPFALWIQDLSGPDPYYVLPLLYGLTIFIQQKLSGQQMMDPMQQKIMNVMPIALTAFFVFFQSGLVLYWLVSNVVGISQQWYITRKLEKEALKH